MCVISDMSSCILGYPFPLFIAAPKSRGEVIHPLKNKCRSTSKYLAASEVKHFSYFIIKKNVCYEIPHMT